MTRASSRQAAPPPKKGGALQWVVLIVAAWLGWHFIFKGRHGHDAGTAQSSTAEQAEPVAASSPPLQGPYARSVRRNDWPPLDAASTATGSSHDLTAVNYYLILDGSGSMTQHRCAGSTSKIDAAVKALQQFIGQIPADANVGLATFTAGTVNEKVPLGLKADGALRQALTGIDVGGGTPLRSAITLGYEALEAQARRQLGYGEYHLVLVTDGQPEPVSEDPGAVVERILDESPVVLHTIGFCIGSDHVLNQTGRTLYVSANDPEQLKAGLQSVLAEVPSFDASAFTAQ